MILSEKKVERMRERAHWVIDCNPKDYGPMEDMETIPRKYWEDLQRRIIALCHSHEELRRASQHVQLEIAEVG